LTIQTEESQKLIYRLKFDSEKLNQNLEKIKLKETELVNEFESFQNKISQIIKENQLLNNLKIEKQNTIKNLKSECDKLQNNSEIIKKYVYESSENKEIFMKMNREIQNKIEKIKTIIADKLEIKKKLNFEILFTKSQKKTKIEKYNIVFIK